MAKSVTFKNNSGVPLYIEIGKPDNVIGTSYHKFENDFDGYPKLGLADIYGSLKIEKYKEKPILYFRNVDLSNNFVRFANILEFGDKPLDVQKGSLFPGKIASSKHPIDGYHKIEENVYGFNSKNPNMTARYDETGLTVTEGDFFNCHCEPWPITLYDHQSTYVATSGLFQPSTFSGYCDGQPFLGLGSYDRLFFNNRVGGLNNVPLGYIAFSCMGIREDDRKEICSGSGSINDDGKVNALYWLEGQQPIVSDHFTVEADWQHLPYVDDGTCVFKDAVIRFENVELHFTGEWGTKGFLDQPRLDKHGQSQMFGTFYVGDKEYKHRLSHTFIENMEAYDYNLKKLGFDVID